MRIVPFPRPEGPPGSQTLAEIEAALHGDAAGPGAESWRELRLDVRSLAAPLSAELERELLARIAERAAAPRRPRRRARPWEPAGLHLRGWLAASARNRALLTGGMLTTALALVAVVFVASHGFGGAGGGEMDAARVPTRTERHFHESMRSSGAAARPALAAAPAPADQTAGPQASASSGASAQARVQQRAATLTLAAKPQAVQSLADEVAQLTVREGGFVQSSQVRLQRSAGGSAELRLSLPSARLSAALASLGRLAPTRAESQSLQDITDEYAAARGNLSDAVAERQALLRALARATTQGEIESLHARIALAAAAVTRARSAFAAISRRGSDSTVEVTVLGDAHAGAARSTLSNGLHDALDALEAVAVALLIALAVLVPVALALLLAALGWRSSRRHLRERALS